MIFSETIDLVLSGRKSQTTRLADPHDILLTRSRPMGLSVAVMDYSDRVRWETGHTYAVQPERCHKARGRFLCTYLRKVEDPTAVDLEYAKAEGLDTLEEYLAIWHRLHKKKPVQPCWAIGMKLVG